jgi:hypothetical protein
MAEANGAFYGNADNFLAQVDNGWQIVGTGDFNGDGLTDILWQSGNGQVTDWIAQPNGGFYGNAPNFLSDIGTGWYIVGTGDFNGDGRDDILLRNDDATLTDWLADANGGLYGNSANFLVPMDAALQVAGVGDFNGDGRSDILWRNQDGQLSGWQNSADGVLTPNFTLDVGAESQIAGIADFNGDGRDDILWRDADSLEVQYSEADGTFLPTLNQLWHKALEKVSAFFDQLTDEISDYSGGDQHDQYSYYDAVGASSPFDVEFDTLFGWIDTVEEWSSANYWDFLSTGTNQNFDLLGIGIFGFTASINGSIDSMEFVSGTNTYLINVDGTALTGIWNPAEQVPSGSGGDPIVITGGGYWSFSPVGTGFDDGASGPGEFGGTSANSGVGNTSPNLNFNFLTQHEGGVRTTGYVPKSGHSGVTIGAGVDLGSQSIADLIAAGVDPALISLFTPYLGLQLDAASAYLANHPLTISIENAVTLSAQLESYNARRIGELYNAASDLNFFDLPMNTQTAIVDLAYQYGLHLSASTPNFWAQVTHGDWEAAYQNLMNFGDNYSTRRHDEASLIQSDIQSGALIQAH